MRGDGGDEVERLKLTRVAQIELAFPLDDDWNVVGARLGLLRSVMHRLLNAAITGLFANRYLADEARRNPLAYIKDEVSEIEGWAQKKGVDHLADLRIPGVITDKLQAYSKDAVQVYFKKKGKARIPSFGEGAPIMIRDGGWSLSQDDEGRFTFSVKLYDGRSSWTRFAVRASKGWHYSLLKRIASDPSVKLGDCRIIRTSGRVRSADGKKVKKWMAKMSFTTNDPVPDHGLNPNIAMALNRGRHNFLYAACTAVGKHRIVWPGEDILAAKQKFSAQRHARKRKMRVLGQGARGHGRGRRYRDYHPEGDPQEKAYVQTVCQQAAAEVVRIAKMWRAATVVIEDFSKIEAEDLRYIPSWPWYQLKQSILWACKKDGIKVIESPSEYISSKCPRCGNLDTSQHNLSTGTFHCKVCDFERDADLVATLNMLDAEFEIEQWRKGFEEERKLVEAIEARRLEEIARGLPEGTENGEESEPAKGGSRKRGRKRRK